MCSSDLPNPKPQTPNPKPLGENFLQFKIESMESNQIEMIDHYELLKKIGEGAESKVYSARDTSSENGNVVAIKLINRKDPDTILKNTQSMIKEAKLLQDLRHQNIVSVYELNPKGHLSCNGKTSVQMYMAIQYAAKGALVYYLMNNGSLSESVSKCYFRQLISGLEYMHHKGYAHRDLKPDNLLLDENYNLLIADFGHSTLLRGPLNDGMLRTKTVGTTLYNPPEIWTQKEYEGQPMDVFMAGVVLFILVTGVPPFRDGAAKTDPFYKYLYADNPEAFWKTHFIKHPITKTLSKELMDLIDKCLNRDPAIRPNIQQIKKSIWFMSEAALIEDVQVQLKGIDQKSKAKRTERLSKAKIRASFRIKTKAPAPHRPKDEQRSGELEQSSIVKNLNTTDGEMISAIMNLSLPDTLQDFDEDSCNTFHMYYSGLNAVDTLKAAAVVASNLEAINLRLQPEDCQASAEFAGESDSVTVVMRVYRGPADTSVLEFHKVQGSFLDFSDKTKDIRAVLEELERKYIEGSDE